MIEAEGMAGQEGHVQGRWLQLGRLGMSHGEGKWDGWKWLSVIQNRNHICRECLSNKATYTSCRC